VADRLPRRAAVVRTLDHLAEPAARLRRVQPARVGRRALQVVDLPAREVRPADLPPIAPAVRRQDECALARADENPYPAHLHLLAGIPEGPSGEPLARWPSHDRRGRMVTTPRALRVRRGAVAPRPG